MLCGLRTLRVCIRAFDSRFGQKLLLIFQVEYNITFGINVPDYPIVTYETRLWDRFEICVSLVVNNNRYSSHAVDNMIFKNQRTRLLHNNREIQTFLQIRKRDSNIFANTNLDSTFHFSFLSNGQTDRQTFFVIYIPLRNTCIFCIRM